MVIEVNKHNYKMIKNYREAYEKEDFLNRFEDYFSKYDYIVGDYAYGKLRLKGFYNEKHKEVSKINNFSDLDKYLEDNCAFECKYFVLEKK